MEQDLQLDFMVLGRMIIQTFPSHILFGDAAAAAAAGMLPLLDAGCGATQMAGWSKGWWVWRKRMKMIDAGRGMQAAGCLWGAGWDRRSSWFLT